MEFSVDYLTHIVSHTDFKVVDLGEGKVRVSSEVMKFNFTFDTLKEAIDFVTDIN